MPEKCKKCQLSFASSELPAKCVDCSSLFHPACTRQGSAQDLAEQEVKSWKCDECESDAMSAGDNTPIMDKDTFPEAIKSFEANQILSQLLNSKSKLNDVDEKIRNTFPEAIKSLEETLQELHDLLPILNQILSQHSNPESKVNDVVEKLKNFPEAIKSWLEDLQKFEIKFLDLKSEVKDVEERHMQETKKVEDEIRALHELTPQIEALQERAQRLQRDSKLSVASSDCKALVKQTENDEKGQRKGFWKFLFGRNSKT